MRYLVLYLRARHVLPTLAAACACTLLIWSLAASSTGEQQMAISIVVLLVLLLAASVAPTLGGHDDALESTAALLWPPRRAAHLLVALAVIVALVLMTLLTGTRFGPAALVLRDAAGLLGLTALGATLLGPAYAWFLPLSWTLPVVMINYEGPSVMRQVLNWQSQPHDSRSAVIAAVVIAVTGALVFMAKGPAVRDVKSAA